MNYVNQLEQLRIVAEAKYDLQRKEFEKVLLEEAALRLELNRLAQLDKPNSSGNGDLVGVRVIGADVLWQGWLSRSNTTLNMKLARVLARKALEQDRVRVAFGKLVALSALVDEHRQALFKQRAQVNLNSAIDLTLSARNVT